MGNASLMPCGNIATISDDHSSQSDKSDIWFDKIQSDADQDAAFLEPHTADWQQRAILSQEQVKQAFARQNLELQRRERDRQSALQHSEGSDASSVHTPPPRAAATKAKLKIGPGENVALVLEDQHLANLIADPPETPKRGNTTRRPVTPSPQQESTLLTLDDLSVGILPCGLSENEKRTDHILHLKLRAPSAKFYQHRLAKALPYAPFSKAVNSGILTTSLTPPRIKRRRNQTPALTTTSDDESSAASARLEIDYRQGPASFPIRLLVTGESFLDLSLTGSLGLMEDRQKLGKFSSIPFPENYLVLMNSVTGSPVAVCALRSAHTGPPVMRIYGTKNRVFAQRPAASTGQLGLTWGPSKALYAWAEVVAEGRYPKPTRYEMYMASGSDGCFEEQPSFRASQDPKGGTTIRVVGRTDRESTHRGCATLSLCRDENALGLNDVFWKVSVSEGIDPALFICFAAFCDETMEKTMRLQCEIGRKS